MEFDQGSAMDRWMWNASSHMQAASRDTPSCFAGLTSGRGASCEQSARQDDEKNNAAEAYDGFAAVKAATTCR